MTNQHLSATILRGYVALPHGQVHLYSAGVESSSHTVLCLHNYGRSGAVFTPVIADLARDRRVIAPDLPGFGESDRLPTDVTIEAHAAIIIELLSKLVTRPVDIVGFHVGTAVATEIAASHPELVHRLVLNGLPIFTESEVDAVLKLPLSAPPEPSGAHVALAWNGSWNWAQNVVGWSGYADPMELACRSFLDKTKAGSLAAHMVRAAVRYRFAERLALVQQPVVVLCPKDDLWEQTQRSEAVLRNGRLIRWPDVGSGSVDVGEPRMLQAIHEHFD